MVPNTFVGQVTEKRIGTITPLTSKLVTEIITVRVAITDVSWTYCFKIILKKYEKHIIKGSLVEYYNSSYQYQMETEIK